VPIPLPVPVYRAAPAAPPAPAWSEPAGSCTRSRPCVGPRGGLYYFTSSGARAYLSR
jgi:hypothetical protein